MDVNTLNSKMKVCTLKCLSSFHLKTSVLEWSQNNICFRDGTGLDLQTALYVYSHYESPFCLLLQTIQT